MNYLSSKIALIHAGILATALVGCGGDSGLSGNQGEASNNDDSDDSDNGSASHDAGVKKDGSTTPKSDAGKADSGSTKVDAGTGDKGTGASTGLPCDVQAVVESNCSTCHGATPNNGAPMSLVTLADFQAKGIEGGKVLTQEVHDRINATDGTIMPPKNNLSTPLTTAQKATLNNWIAAGAPAGTDSCDGDTNPGTGGGTDAGTTPSLPANGDTTGLTCYTLTAHGATASSKFAVGTAIDAYYNFTFDAPWKGTQYGVLFNPIIDNSKVLHHFLLFQNTNKTAPTGATHSSGAHPNGQLVYGWAPGATPLDFRTSGVDVGMALADNVSYTIEYHYNSSDPTAQDASGTQVCVSPNKPANIAGISWLGYDQLGVPSATWTGTCVPTNSQPVHILGVQPHMHVTGRHMKAIIHRKGGADETLHDADFDFNNQIHYDKNVTINPGDTITTTCTYSQPMAFGESTGQEMCYLFTYAYAAGQLKDNGPWGSVAHGGSACLGQ